MDLEFTQFTWSSLRPVLHIHYPSMICWSPHPNHLVYPSIILLALTWRASTSLQPSTWKSFVYSFGFSTVLFLISPPVALHAPTIGKREPLPNRRAAFPEVETKLAKTGWELMKQNRPGSKSKIQAKSTWLKDNIWDGVSTASIKGFLSSQLL